MEEDPGERRCVFCGSARMPREHAIPQWVGEVLHGAAGESGDWTTWYAFGTPSENCERRHPAESNRPTVVVKRVCRDCNSGWMADVEGEAKPILEPMISGKPCMLSLGDQLNVATWATKTAMVLEYMRSDLFVTTKAERRVIADDRRPPDGFRVRLAATAAVGDQGLRIATFVAASDPSEGVPDVLCTTIVIGHLVVQVWGGSGSGTTDLQRPGTVIAEAAMVWPPVPGPVSWPPRVSLTGSRLEEFIREPLPGADRPGFLDGWQFLDGRSSATEEAAES